MELVPIGAIAIQGTAKMHHGFSNISFIRNTVHKLAILYGRNVNNRANNRSLVFCAGLIKMVFELFRLIYYVAAAGFCCLPLYFYLKDGKYVLMFAMLIPGCDPETLHGFVITCVYHIGTLYIGIVGILAADVSNMLFILNVVEVADVFKNQLKSLDVILDGMHNDEEIVHRQVLGICSMHEEIVLYSEELESSYGTVILFQIVTSIVEISTGLFIFHMTGHINAFFLVLGAIWQLLEFCLLGVTLTVKNEEIVRALYDLKWYHLSTRHQRMLGLILHKAQNAVEISIGGLAWLNLETFVEVMKTIYSYYAMLKEFIK
ncbi:odorant receptor 67d-like [Uranotaenia lowii]|uniref:odorant receptor 67d-like n=1 Tax=Uranotaenia lowii TaxID=190385 RepID=UPI002478D2FC|nr:odorant receptor 67d-like [Uranotaenia lowii]